jgi:hypothetical protein
MEPANLNSSSSASGDDARLEAFLRQPLPELPDDGFSRRVLAALPERRSPYARNRALACCAGLIVGSAWAWRQIALTGGMTDLTGEFEKAAHATSAAFNHFATPQTTEGLWIATAVTSATLLFAFRQNLRPARR